ncbi:hypothetical protein [Adonisia turfae]|uniref:hypothetical protein n=1 Tax=Adonisia turfae TaxID=2950184 RepID=UPI0013D89AA5|nr:hypothetical protein [Adonisia turfae]
MGITIQHFLKPNNFINDAFILCRDLDQNADTSNSKKRTISAPLNPLAASIPVNLFAESPAPSNPLAASISVPFFKKRAVTESTATAQSAY